MKDNEIRGILLKKYYEKRRDGLFQWQTEDFEGMVLGKDFDEVDIFRACDQLADHGLIEWHPVKAHGHSIHGTGKISAFGVDVVEGHSTPPISINFDSSISVHGSSNVQIGNSNIQDVSLEIQKLIIAIDNANGTEAEKTEAKSLLKQLLEHPLLVSIVGGLASTIKA